MMFLKKKWMKNRRAHPMAAADTGNDPRRECTIATLDRWHSRYVRLLNTDANGICRCITCGMAAHPSELENGHFITRDHWSVRFHSMNCHPQCNHCNGYMGGRQALMGIKIDEKCGAGTAEMLINIGTKKGKLKAYQRYSLCQEYKALVSHELVRTGLEPWWMADK